MIKEIEELINQLQKLDNIEEFDDIVLADMLWLALSMDEVQREKSKRSKKDFLQWLKNWLNSFFTSKTKESSKEAKSGRSTGTKKIYPDGVPLTLDNSSSTNKTKIKVPKKKEFFITDELIKSLSSLKKSYASTNNSTLINEEETVEYIAKTGIVKPHFEPELENYFDLYLMIDISISMQIWQDSIDVFIDKLRSFSLFRNIKILYLDTSVKDAKLYANKSLTLEVLENLNNYEKRFLKFIVSDCISLSWQEGDLLYKLCQYNKKIPTILINMLPKRMWNGTILGNANIAKLHSIREYPTNNFIKSDIDAFLYSIDAEYFKGDILQLPIVNFESDDFKSLSNFILGKKDNFCNGIVANKEEIEFIDVQQNQKMSASEYVDIFFENSSPIAHQLALYLSITTHLTFPIMKMIQHNMLPDSKQIHLAEVFVGGLLDKSKQIGFYTFKVDKDGISIRDILLDRLGNYKAMATLQQNSKFIAQNLGSSLDFTALMHGDFQNKEWSDADKVFANIAQSVLNKIGGNYAKIASKITQPIESEEYETIFKIPTSKRFQMGSNDGQDDEKPVHEVILNYDFEIAQYPVTAGEFKAFVADTSYRTEAERGDGAYVWDGKDWKKKKDANWKNPYFEQTQNNPVVCVSWNDAKAYCKWLSEKTGENYRLPTEAELEYSCRAGTTMKWNFGDDKKELEKYAWYNKNRREKTHPVGEKPPNPWELYDMHGNVWEWCEDWFVDNYKETPRDGSVNEGGDQKYKVLRGGSWNLNNLNSRSTLRDWLSPTSRSIVAGFRLLRTLPS